MDKEELKYKRNLIKIYEKRGDRFSIDLAKGHRRDIEKAKRIIRVIKVKPRKRIVKKRKYNPFGVLRQKL